RGQGRGRGPAAQGAGPERERLDRLGGPGGGRDPVQPRSRRQLRRRRLLVRPLPHQGRLDRALLGGAGRRSEEQTSELQSRENLVCRLLLEKKKKTPVASP